MSSVRKAGMVFAAFAFMWISTIASFAETINYTYDDMLRLIKAQYGDGTTVDYTYDSLGNRLIKTTTLPGAPTNTPPGVASSPTPADSAPEISTTPTLSWTGTGDPDAGDEVVYSVYFGSSSNPPLVATGVEANFSPGVHEGVRSQLLTHLAFVVFFGKAAIKGDLTCHQLSGQG